MDKGTVGLQGFAELCRRGADEGVMRHTTTTGRNGKRTHRFEPVPTVDAKTALRTLYGGAHKRSRRGHEARPSTNQRRTGSRRSAARSSSASSGGGDSGEDGESDPPGDHPQAGRETAECAAPWCDLPRIGTKYCDDADCARQRTAERKRRSRKQRPCTKSCPAFGPCRHDRFNRPARPIHSIRRIRRWDFDDGLEWDEAPPEAYRLQWANHLEELSAAWIEAIVPDDAADAAAEDFARAAEVAA